MPHFVQTKPFVVPTTDGKLIEEHTGLTSTGEFTHSIARMVAPSGWAEPFQQPIFDEYTLVNKGKKQFEIDGATIVLEAGQSMLIKAGSRVRYSNPFDEPCEYWSICIPAFSIETVNRE
ncbi:MAG: cupin domain-containing protein [Ferruginibacter sp.]